MPGDATKLRVLVVATKCPWPPTDGGRLVLAETLRAVADAGAEVTLVVPAARGGAPAPTPSRTGVEPANHVTVTADARGPGSTRCYDREPRHHRSSDQRRFTRGGRAARRRATVRRRARRAAPRAADARAGAQARHPHRAARAERRERPVDAPRRARCRSPRRGSCSRRRCCADGRAARWRARR